MKTAASDSPSVNIFSRLFLQLRLAAGFLTILPLMPARPAPEAAVAASFAWFPLVGAVLGGVVAVENLFLRNIVPHALCAILVLLSLVILTGGIHLDALADTADALGAGRDHNRALEIMRDSRIGSFGAIAIFFALALETVSLATVPASHATATLIAAITLSRWAMVTVSYGMRYLRPTGAGVALLGELKRGPLSLGLATALAATIAAALILWSSAVVAGFLTALLVPLVMRAFYAAWLGGVTGDAIGACGQVTEAIVMLTIASYFTLSG